MAESRETFPAERAAERKRWAASYERGPDLPNSAIGRNAIYDRWAPTSLTQICCCG